MEEPDHFGLAADNGEERVVGCGDKSWRRRG
jgi:hypothetical protein